MPLPIPNLDDKSFTQIVEEGRSLIPSTAPEWTDHNVHDPGITFIELFAWLAEIEHYRLNRTSAASFENFFALAGLTRAGRRPAEVTIALDVERLKRANSPRGVLLPANTVVTAVGNEGIPFQTLEDRYLTTAELKKAVTQAGGRRVPQPVAQTRVVVHEGGSRINKTVIEEDVPRHYDAFGPSPAAGDSLELGFDGWFDEAQGHLAITLFEDDLPARTPFAPGAQGFAPSARISWEYLTDSGWKPLPLIEDGTLHLSRSGEVSFGKPEAPRQPRADGLHWLRVILVEGRYEIPPRISGIRTNTIRARQVETIVNEDLGAGLGTPDQMVRLKKWPLLIDSEVSVGPFRVGDVLDWQALVTTLARPSELGDPRHAEAVEYVAQRLRENTGAVINPDLAPLEDDEKQRLAQAFDRLLDLPNFYRREKFAAVRIPEELLKATAGQAPACQEREHTRRLNRYLLQSVLADHIVSDRVVIQTGIQTERTKQDSRSLSTWECKGQDSGRWNTWEPVDDFSQSGPNDRHYVPAPETGHILFGNGLNGSVPQSSDAIRARFYRHSQEERGNLSAVRQWQLALPQPDGGRIKLRGKNPEPSDGGRMPETIDEAKARSRAVFRKPFTVLTAKDYEAAALGTPGLRVARAKVVANFNPQLPLLTLPGEVMVVVVPQPAPKAAFPDAPPPEPSDGFRATVRNHLEARRLVATNLHVVGPQYVKVAVGCDVYLKKNAAPRETLESIMKALAEFLDPIRGGPDRRSGWPFGRAVFPSEIHQQLAKVAGVDYVARVRLNGQQPGQLLSLPNNGLPTPGEHKVELIPFEHRRRNPHAGEGGGKRD